MVSQGHDGKYTHKGDWSKAFDFLLLDEEMKSYVSNGLLCVNYHCYNKPVLAPADGIVEEIIDKIDDNEIGKTNTVNNWGNTIIIRHLPGLYTQLSHLKKRHLQSVEGRQCKMWRYFSCLWKFRTISSTTYSLSGADISQTRGQNPQLSIRLLSKEN